MAKKKYASLRADMIKTVQAKRTVYLSIDDGGNLIKRKGFAIIPVKAA